MKQQDAMRNAIRDIENRFTKDEHVTASYQCGANLRVVASGGMTPVEHCVITMLSYNTPIARVDLCDINEDGDNAPVVEVHCRYCNYSVTTSRHLTYFLEALRKQCIIGLDVFERRMEKKDLERRAREALPLIGPKFDGFITL